MGTKKQAVKKAVRKASPNRIELENIGPIKSADIEFGDLTVLVGPQAVGKSIFLQLLKLLADKGSVQRELKHFNFAWDNKTNDFLDLFFGEGMRSIFGPNSRIKADRREIDVNNLGKKDRARDEEQLFYVPAQRVMSLVDGLTRNFMSYRQGDPFVIRQFSEELHRLMQREISTSRIFPANNRLKAPLRNAIEKHIFGKATLLTDTSRSERRIVLSPESGVMLPYLVWSAGQREFVPLLLGLYWLMPPGATSRRGAVKTVVLEEVEMGLHPQAISTLLAVVLELLRRGYRVVMSTHSPHVLDLVWGIRFAQQHGGNEADVLTMLDLPNTAEMRPVAASALKAAMKVYFFERSGHVKDISKLDVSSGDSAEANWGGLTEFSGRVSEVVSNIANREEAD
ncbi:MAG: AAA family ATPase [Luteimonas sp.]